jgi:hypothetical protein
LWPDVRKDIRKSEIKTIKGLFALERLEWRLTEMKRYKPPPNPQSFVKEAAYITLGTH